MDNEIINHDTYNSLNSSARRILRHLKGETLKAIVTDFPLEDDRGASSGVVILCFADKEVRLDLDETPNKPGYLGDVASIDVVESHDKWTLDWAVTPINQKIRFLETLTDHVQVDGWNPEKPIFIWDVRGIVLSLEDITLVIDKEMYWSTCWHISIWCNGSPVIPNKCWVKETEDEKDVSYSCRLFSEALFPPYVSRLLPPQLPMGEAPSPDRSDGNHHSFMVVPKSQKIAAYGFYTDDTTDDDYVFTEFSYYEQKQIFHLLIHFDDEFDILIDNYEEEEIKAEDVPTALAIAREFYELTEKCGEREVAHKVIQALEYAASIKMPMWFWF